MKATVWLWPIVTLVCISPFVGVYAQQEYQSYSDFPSDNSLIQDYFGERNKRGRGSLSIVNPIDVLRQRLLLEIARRQMKANSKQVEINRAYLKAIGKRDTAHKLLQQQQQQQENQQYSQIQDKIPVLTVPIQPIPLQQQQHTQHEQNLQALQQRQPQQNRNHLLLQPNNKLYDFLKQQQQQQYNGNIIGIGDDGTIPESTLLMGDLKDNLDLTDNEINDRNNGDDDDYQIRYLYRLHKNRFSKE